MANYNFKDHSGEKFGRWTAIKWERRKNEKGRTDIYYLCVCGCSLGVSKWILAEILTSGDSKSCGCLMGEMDVQRTRKEIRDTVHPLYRIWCGIRARCYSPGVKGYKLYGAKGVRMCDRWYNDFRSFVEDVSPRPSKHHTIDRYPNRRGNYEPENWRWATPKMQAENRDSTSFITVDGITDTLYATSLRVGLLGGQTWRKWMDRGFSPQEIADQKRNLPKGHGTRPLFSTMTIDASSSPLTLRKRLDELFERVKRDSLTLSK